MSSSADPTLGDRFVFVSMGMRELARMVIKAAAANCGVLIVGESGTGKEEIARAIHRLSPRRARPFEPIACAAIPAELFEAEVFGHEAGAYTGAIAARAGRIERADGGTVFLDDIDDTPMGMQVKLLRAVQEKEVERIGDKGPRRVNVRYVAASKVDLGVAVAMGRFRNDLYWRLKVVEVRIPPLRERPEDIIPLAEHFMVLYGEGRGYTLSEAVRKRLIQHSWPGNVRELENAVQRAIVMSGAGTELSERDLVSADSAIGPLSSIDSGKGTCPDVVEAIARRTLEILLEGRPPVSGLLRRDAASGDRVGVGLADDLVAGLCLGFGRYLDTENGERDRRTYSDRHILESLGLSVQTKKRSQLHEAMLEGAKAELAKNARGPGDHSKGTRPT